MADFTTIKSNDLPVTSALSAGDFVIVLYQGKLYRIAFDVLASIFFASSISAAEIRTKLESLTGVDRVAASAVKYAAKSEKFQKSNGQTIAVPAKTRVLEVLLTSSTTQTISIGTTNAGVEVVDNVEVVANSLSPNYVGAYFASAGSLYVTCTGTIDIHLITIEIE